MGEVIIWDFAHGSFTGVVRHPTECSELSRNGRSEKMAAGTLDQPSQALVLSQSLGDLVEVA